MKQHPRPKPIAYQHLASTDEVDHIVQLVTQARPSWELWLLRAVLLGHRDQVDATDLAIAAIRAAQNPDYTTPRAIGWRGPHWDGLMTQPLAIAQSRDRCGVCGKTEPRCYGERSGPDDHKFESTLVSP